MKVTATVGPVPVPALPPAEYTLTLVLNEEERGWIRKLAYYTESIPKMLRDKGELTLVEGEGLARLLGAINVAITTPRDLRL